MKFNEQEDIIFCIECGSQLRNFCFSNEADDPKIVKKIFLKCKCTGKFNGELCSKVYISRSEDPEPLIEIV